MNHCSPQLAHVHEQSPIHPPPQSPAAVALSVARPYCTMLHWHMPVPLSAFRHTPGRGHQAATTRAHVGWRSVQAGWHEKRDGKTAGLTGLEEHDRLLQGLCGASGPPASFAHKNHDLPLCRRLRGPPRGSHACMCGWDGSAVTHTHPGAVAEIAAPSRSAANQHRSAALHALPAPPPSPPPPSLCLFRERENPSWFVSRSLSSSPSSRLSCQACEHYLKRWCWWS